MSDVYVGCTANGIVEFYSDRFYSLVVKSCAGSAVWSILFYVMKKWIEILFKCSVAMSHYEVLTSLMCSIVDKLVNYSSVRIFQILTIVDYELEC